MVVLGSPAAGLAARAQAAMVPLVERARHSVVQLWSGPRGAGAGFLWDEQGRVLTNDHVVAHAAAPLRIRLADGEVHEAQLLARAPELDLALLSTPLRDTPHAPLGHSARLRVGELLIAVGHPWGEQNVVTLGIVSGVGEVAVGRAGATLQAIRSDVRLAPGNSGGPLFDASGRVVGINSMIFGGDLSIAIPIDVARAWVAERLARAA